MDRDPTDSDFDELLAFVRSVTAFSGRVAGSAEERQTQELLAGRLQPLGFDAVVEGAVCPPRPPWILALHAGFALLAGVLLFVSPLLATLLAALTGVSFWGELRGAPLILQRLLLRRVSGNMVARLRRPGPLPARSDYDQRAAPKIVLVAHADVASGSALFTPWVRRLWDEPATDEAKGDPPRAPREAGRARSRRLRLHPGTIVLVAAGVQTAVSTGWWLGLHGLASHVALGACAVVQVGLAAVAFDWWRSPPVEGAIDNASGLAVLLGVARRVAASPLSHAELWVVATGDREPDADGMAAFLFQFGALLEPANTFFINVDDVGEGALHIGISEGRWDRLAYRPFLTGLAERVARTARFGPVPLAELVGTTDAGPPTEAGFAAVTLTGLVDGRPPVSLHTAADTYDALDPSALARALQFVHALVRAADLEIGAGSGDALDDRLEETEHGRAAPVPRPAGVLP